VVGWFVGPCAPRHVREGNQCLSVDKGNAVVPLRRGLVQASMAAHQSSNQAGRRRI
jgi:hypothetical protein